MARALAQAGVTVVSGMALGIDGASHRGALEGPGSTIAVLGSGFRVIYPASHRPLFHDIEQHGLLLTEFLPSEKALPHHFPKRNRIIAALSSAVIVVEAAEKSGALITVDHALDLGRDVFATPGSVENPQAVGSNFLLRDGARVLPRPEAVVEDLQESGLIHDIPVSAEDPEVLSGVGVPPELSQVWEALTTEPMGAEEVAVRTELPLTRVLAGLSSLELGGWARRCPGMRFRRV
jgi:DNA processing protein